MVVPVVGDTLNIAEAIGNPTPVNIAVAAIGVIPVVGPEIATVAKAARSEVTIYRVFGGDARAERFSWTTEDPRSVNNFRDAAGLPSDGSSGAINMADFMIKVTANAADIIKSRSALPLDGNKGGLP